ncbi:MAG: hypothetical protein AAGD11_09765 [Planctomycetota bacterium]
MKYISRLFIGMLALIYIAFLIWFGGSSQPMSVEEVASRLARINELSVSSNALGSEIGLDDLRALCAGDDGGEFFMVNLIKYRDKAMYPQGMNKEMGDDPMAANNRYGRTILPYLIKNGSFPVYMSNVSGRLIHPDRALDWDAVGIVRYRSRRDFLNMIEQILKSTSPVMVHKWASVERTQVFPTSTALPWNSSSFVKIVVFALLVAFATIAIYSIRLIRCYVRRSQKK